MSIKVENKNEYDNLLSEKFKLKFNAHTIKKWLKMRYNNDRYIQISEQKPLIYNAHIMLSALLQIIIKSILNNISCKLVKTKSGMFDINRTDIENCIRYNDDYYLLYNDLLKYDNKMDYSYNLCVNKKRLEEIIDAELFMDTIKINSDSLNYLYYIITQTAGLIADIAFVCKGDKKSVSHRNIFSAVQILFRNDLLQSMKLKYNDIVEVLNQNKIKKENDKKKKEETNDDENIEDDSNSDNDNDSDNDSEDKNIKNISDDETDDETDDDSDSDND